MSLITISTMSDKFKIGGAVARQAMRELYAKELIVRVGDTSSSCPIYRGSQWSLKKDQEEAEKKLTQKGGKKEKTAKKEAEAAEADDE